MGRSYTPKYRLEIREAGVDDSWISSTKMSYDYPVNMKALKDWVACYEASKKPGGVNAHLRPSILKAAKVVRQSTGEVVFEYTRPEPTSE